MSTAGGTVYSHTTIHVAGNAHASDVPFVLVLVDCDDGVRRLGRWAEASPPAIGSRATKRVSTEPYLVFST